MSGKVLVWVSEWACVGLDGDLWVGMGLDGGEWACVGLDGGE